jgi:hypothetical protein
VAELFETDSFDQKVRDALVRIMRSEFDHEVRREIAIAALSDPGNFPAEFRGWVGPYIELQNIQLPFSQVVGNTLTADNVAGLGGNIHGRKGTIFRGGDFLGVSYDAENGVWASDPLIVATSFLNLAYSSTSYTSNGGRQVTDSTGGLFTLSHTIGGMFPLATLAGAGLKAQVRLVALISPTGGGTAHFTLAQATANAGDPEPSFTEPSWSINTSALVALKDSGWRDLESAIASNPKDFAFLLLVGKISGGISAGIRFTTVFVRYISA